MSKNITKKIKCLNLLAASSLIALGAGCALDSDEAQVPDVDLISAQGEHHGGGHGGHCEPSPVMLSGDFDGDGTITPADIHMLEAYVDRDDYAAFFDMNADGKLNGRDVSAVAKRMGEASAARDQEVARAFADSERFRDIRVALANGFGPFTGELKGHGLHWANMERIGRWASNPGFDAGMPEGLNYDANGRLVAAFYYSPGAFDISSVNPAVPPRTVVMDIPAGEGFTGHEDTWHNHVGACFNGLGTATPDFDQCVAGPECEADLWSAKFHMLHIWMFDYNPCGAFAGINPNVSHHAPPEPHAHACDIEDVVGTVLPYTPAP